MPIGLAAELAEIGQHHAEWEDFARMRLTEGGDLRRYPRPAALSFTLYHRSSTPSTKRNSYRVAPKAGPTRLGLVNDIGLVIDARQSDISVKVLGQLERFGPTL